ncbi:inorganic polyphosphate/ATP-glucomannokinase [Mycobacterium xenopi 4042]|uniref:Inorganic polyphosphate/ATP-glucomannokinase n=1 Tax=Mycobacterium xenopi 4042 TaxID=1299334 RepID=X8CH44_MYCXE|nr:inorganic polyphosphate/ATP-glucomannokinase [Mycobacterium xenopi 4042]
MSTSSVGRAARRDLPGVVTEGVVQTAANVDKSWIGISARDVISTELNGQQVTVLNDADAAGLAEERYGAGKDKSGVVVLLTFGTGIGSAVIHNGKLLPNTEFGHLEVGGKEAEHRAASSVKERRGWSYKKWAGRSPRCWWRSRMRCGLTCSSSAAALAARPTSGCRCSPTGPRWCRPPCRTPPALSARQWRRPQTSRIEIARSAGSERGLSLQWSAAAA